MVNKKGYLRIIEAVIAVLIVLGAVLFAISKDSSTPSENFCRDLQSYLDEIGKDNILRTAVLENKLLEIENFLQNRMSNPLIDYEIKICSPEDLCTLDKSGLDNIEVCAGERLISATPESENLSPKKHFRP